MSNYPSISLCMIVKNEVELLREALESVRAVCSEFIVVDTGSTDGTVDVAGECGARVIEEEWEGDFSKPRNTALATATGDWILVIDADERIDSSQHHLLRELTLYPHHCYLFTQRHYTDDPRLSAFVPCAGEYPHWEGEYVGYFESSLCRLFPNDPRIRYRNPVHELVEPSIQEHGELVLVRSPIILQHYGNTPEMKERKGKAALYTSLGERKVLEQPTTWKAFFELGVEHNGNRRLTESLEAFGIAVKLNPEYVLSWMNLGYVLTELGRHREAIAALQEGLKRDPDHPEVHCNIAVAHMRDGNYAAAVGHLGKALLKKPEYVNAYSNLGICLMKLGRVSEAAKVFEDGYKLAPGNARLLLQFGHALFESGIVDEARIIIEQAIQLAPKEAASWELLGRAFEVLEMKGEAQTAFREAAKLREGLLPDN